MRHGFLVFTAALAIILLAVLASHPSGASPSPLLAAGDAHFRVAALTGVTAAAVMPVDAVATKVAAGGI